jgi:hypothetical protein
MNSMELQRSSAPGLPRPLSMSLNKPSKIKRSLVIKISIGVVIASLIWYLLLFPKSPISTSKVFKATHWIKVALAITLTVFVIGVIVYLPY